MNPANYNTINANSDKLEADRIFGFSSFTKSENGDNIAGTTTLYANRKRNLSGIFLSQIPFNNGASLLGLIHSSEFAVRATPRNKASNRTNKGGCYKAVVEPLPHPLQAVRFSENLTKTLYKMKNLTSKIKQFFNRNRHSKPEENISLTLTEREVHNLVWLWYSQVQMNELLGHLVEPLDKIGSRFSPTVYSHHHEYKRQYKNARPLIERVLKQFAEKPNADPETLKRLNKLFKLLDRMN